MFIFVHEIDTVSGECRCADQSLQLRNPDEDPVNLADINIDPRKRAKTILHTYKRMSRLYVNKDISYAPFRCLLIKKRLLK